MIHTKKDFVFTSESVCAGHPDKICDQISDAIVDEVLKQDPYGRVAVETLATFDRVIIAGEVSAHAKVNYKKVAHKQIKRLGYTNASFNFSYQSPINVFVHTQSPEISKGVDKKGAGDQGLMFGFACRETEALMPLPITIAHRLAYEIDQAREKKILPYLYPDGKTQVTLEYKGGKPYRIQKIVCAVPHKKSVHREDVRDAILKKIIKPSLEKYGLTIDKRHFIFNGTGVWHSGGPAADSGLTGRKIVVDTYGGYARVGGGCFSGKDPTKVDRSGSYAARFIAKNIVAKKLADKAEVSLSYYIGAKKPIMFELETFGTSKTKEKTIRDFAKKILDTSVEGILKGLNLLQPIYLPTAAYGHFGRDSFPWETIV
ncbi:methionine adenosyltransferase [Candidatus Roizmanbacteria bacterium]|nr:methionine adenosyltransferase [Candidatus Roizmanbacteria bacterium]